MAEMLPRFFPLETELLCSEYLMSPEAIEQQAADSEAAAAEREAAIDRVVSCLRSGIEGNRCAIQHGNIFCTGQALPKPALD